MAPSSRPPRWYWEDFAVGSTREHGGYAVRREATLAFARDFDPQPFHLDDAAAERSLFGRLSASGWHTCAMAMRMMCDGWLLDSASLGSPGIESLRWPKPVFAGDVLRIESRVVEARPLQSRPGVGIARSETTVFNQDDEPVLAMLGNGFFRRRPPAG